jgi:O-succinylhomoserine sulfhydrylase
MSEKKRNPHLQSQTKLIHEGVMRSQWEETGEAIFMTSGFVYESAEAAEDAFKNDGSRFVYSRYANPTMRMLELRLAAYEGAPRCFLTGSGMAAVFASLMCWLKAGDRVVAPHAMFGSCIYILNEILPRYGITPVLIDGTNLDEWRAALAQPTQAVFLETPANPTLDIVDLPAVCELAKKAGALVMVDNVFATPVYQKPRQFGADVVIYSATKHIDGQGRSLGGAILCDDEFAKLVAPFLRHTGPALSPFNAWILLKGLETLELRVNAQSASAAQLAAFLENQPEIEKLRYPGLKSHPGHDIAKKQMTGFGNLICFDVKGGRDAAFRFMNALTLMTISNNLGDAKTLITHPATTTHQRLSDAEKARAGISAGTVRISVGLEAAADLLADLTQALKAMRAAG